MGGLVHKADRRRYLLSKYADHHHEVERAFKLFHLDKYGQLMWLDKWSQIDKDENNMVEYGELIDFFELPDILWTRRLYDLINVDMNGALDFLEFFMFTAQYCLLNKEALMEFSFRLLSRRGSTFEVEHSVLDVHDISKFLEQKYFDITPKELKKRTQQLFEQMDSDLSGGISLDEFTELVDNEDTLSFVSLGWYYLDKFRKGLFGPDYWKHISPPYSEKDELMFSQVSELAPVVIESSEYEYFPDDFPVLYKKIKQKRKEKKKRQENQRCIPVVTIRAYARLVMWFRVIAFQDTSFYTQVAFKHWHLITHGDQGIPQQKNSFDQDSITVSEIDDSGTSTFSEQMVSDSISEIGMEEAGLEPLIKFKSSVEEDTLSDTSNVVGEYCVMKKPKTIYELLNEPREKRWVPKKVLYEDYEKHYVQKLHHKSKYDNEPHVPPHYLRNVNSASLKLNSKDKN
mmetsp:Transcript_28119/g.36845  ORF Transcript_28119/g.36845 Transcript_28119/m.36845 type:complete len:457 (+) Transcript_28119:180-1550(+)